VRALDADDHRVSVFIGRHRADLDDGGLLVGVVISESTEVAPACQARGAARIAAMSSGSLTHHTNGLPNAVRRRAI
jgi:hypothetical protein